MGAVGKHSGPVLAKVSRKRAVTWSDSFGPSASAEGLLCSRSWRGHVRLACKNDPGTAQFRHALALISDILAHDLIALHYRASLRG